MKRKYFKLSIFVFIFSVFSISFSCKAAEEYKMWNIGNVPVVDKLKKWSITFNKEVDIQSAKNSVFIYKEDTNEKVNAEITSSGKTISIVPSVPYESGQKYYLAIGKDIKSIDNKVIEQPVKYDFSVKEDQIESNIINSYDDFYNGIKKAMLNYEESITFSISNYDKNVYDLKTVTKVALDNPELMGIYSSATSETQYSNPVKLTIKFKYNDTKENLIKKEQAVQNKVKQIVQSVIKPDMKDYEKELALHDYVVNNCKYDKRVLSGNMPRESYTAYGVLIDGTGVCQGYAEAMYRLLKAVNIENIVVAGEVDNGSGWGGHAWNIVKIQGQYYHLDATWDDPVTSDGVDKLTHDYFNIADSQISKDHRWDATQYPKCNSDEYSFSNLNIKEVDTNGNIIVPIKSYDEFYDCIIKALNAGEMQLNLKIVNYDENVYNINSTMNKIYKSGIKISGYSYKLYKNDVSGSMYITMNFK